MSIVTRPLVARHHIIGVVATAAAAAGLTVGLTLAFNTTGAAQRGAHLTRADRTLCQELANATPGSPASFRLADMISTQGSC